MSQKTWYFWMKLGFYAGLARTHARSQAGTRLSLLKPFYRGAKITAIGAISINQVLAVMAIKDSMDGPAFALFIENLLCPELWAGALVVMDNLPVHKLASIVPMIEAVGTSFIYLLTLAYFMPIELGWSQLKSFLRKFAPTNASMIDTIIAVALNLINPQHLRNWGS
ncbi:transposase [Microcoleus sp. B3-D7]|uniref:transposase n=1 Tax=Microcoleus sp. B3-D7 TaxID=2818659 RepID=UPI002FD2305B